MKILEPVKYIHQIYRTHDDQKILALYTERGVEIGEPVVLNKRREVRRAIYIILEEQFNEHHFGIRYTSTDSDSNRIVKGIYLPPKARQGIRKGLRIYVRRKASKLKKLISDSFSNI